MVLPTPGNMMRIVTNTLNLVDARLIDHGMNVGALTSHVLRQGSRFSRKEIHDIVIAAVLHDIGAYKTEEIDRMVEFELHDVWSHSVFGNLYLKHFSPLADVAPAVLFHHADYRRFRNLSGTSAEVGQIINIADRIDILSRHGLRKGDDFLKYFEQQRGKAFRPDLLDLFHASDIFRIVSERGIDNHLGIDLDFDEQECLDYIKMVVLSIDLRSEQTVTHTMAVAAGARQLALLFDMTDDEIDNIHPGALLHDLGKQGVPVAILESPHRLDDAQMDIMKSHVSHTDNILRGNIDDTIRRIASRHHERLDGTGYHLGLDGSELTFSERLVAVADVLSALGGVRTYKDAFPKEKIIAILDDMVARRHLDETIVAMVKNRYDRVMDAVNAEAAKVLALNDRVNAEYLSLMERINNIGPDDDAFSVLPEVPRDLF